MNQTDRLLLDFVRAQACSCPTCAAPLGDLQSNRCPQCSEELVLDVALADPCTRPLALGAVGLGLGFGFCASLGGIVFVQGFLRGLGGVAWSRILPLYVGAFVLGPALIVWACVRRRIRSMTPRTRKWPVIACWLLTASFVAWLAANVILRV